MGTNGAFGGSGAASWEQVREEWVSLGSSSTHDSLPGDASDASDAEAAPIDDSTDLTDAAYDPLIAAIAQALLGEDKDAHQPRVPSFTLTSVLPRPGGGRSRGASDRGGGGGGSSGGGGTSSASRSVTAQAARGGSAIGAAAAGSCQGV